MLLKAAAAATAPARVHHAAAAMSPVAPCLSLSTEYIHICTGGSQISRGSLHEVHMEFLFLVLNTKTTSSRDLSCRPHPPTARSHHAWGRVPNFPLRPHRPLASIPRSSQSRRTQPLTQADHFSCTWMVSSRAGSLRGHHSLTPCHWVDVCPIHFSNKTPF